MSLENALEEFFAGLAQENQEYETTAYEEPPAQYQFITGADETVCEECNAFNGDIFSEDEIDDFFDAEWDELTPEIVRANVHINCRCQLMRISEPEEEEEFPELL